MKNLIRLLTPSLLVVCNLGSIACNHADAPLIATSKGPVQGPKVSDLLQRQGEDIEIQLTIGNDTPKKITDVIINDVSISAHKSANTLPRAVGDLEPGHSTTFNLIVPSVKANKGAGELRIDYSFIGAGGKAAGTTYINNEPIP